MNELVLQSATRQLELLRTRKILVVDLAEAHIRQIELLNPRLNAYVDFDPDRVRKQARWLEDQGSPRGPLFGLPVSIKSSISVAGYRCEIGSKLNRGNRPETDAVIVSRLREAGALILGTTNCPEFLMAYETDNLLHGRTNNPWNLDYTPGGSSGGESAAIAAGMSSCGLGSDSGGSVREPAHFTGICSLKPTPGRIPSRGHLPPCVGPFSTLGAIGPMARTIEDVSLLFNTLAGHDPMDPTSTSIALRSPNLKSLRSKTIGYFEDDGFVPVTPDTRLALQSSVNALRDAGFRLEPFRPKSLEELRKLWLIFFVQCGAMFYEPTIRGRSEDLSPIFSEFLGVASVASPLSATTLLQAWADLDLVREQMLEEMQRYPFLLCPVASIPAFRHGERHWAIDGQQVNYLDAMRYQQWFNVLGAPAAVIPIRQSEEGLPIAVQIAGRPFEDENVLAIASALEDAFGYKAPPIALS